LAEQAWLEDHTRGLSHRPRRDDAESLYVVVKGGVNVLKGNEQFLAFLGRADSSARWRCSWTNRAAAPPAAPPWTPRASSSARTSSKQFCTSRPDAGLVIYRAIIRTLAERLQSTSADLAYLMGAQVRQQSRGHDDSRGGQETGHRQQGGPA